MTTDVQHKKDRPLPIRCATFALAALTIFAGIAPALAADAPPPPLTIQDQATVQKAVDYIESLKAVEGRFTQTDARGHVSTGLFYMQRPGKIRFQYDPPTQLLVVSDGAEVSVYDRRLKSFDQYPLAQTPLALLLAKPFKLDHGVTILAVEQSSSGFSIAAGDARRRSLGRLTLQFSQAPLALEGWSLIDAQGQRTDVKFAALKQRTSLAPGLFTIRNPKPRPDDSIVTH